MAQLSPYDYGSVPYLGTDFYSAEEDLLKLAAKYFYDGENIELSSLRPSVFGMFSQAAALIMKNGMFHRNALYDEFFLNSASFDSSIYNFANELNYTIGLAIPAKVTLAVGIKEADLISASDVIGGDTSNRVFKIDKFSLIYMDKFQYMLPNSVIIQCKKLGATTTSGSSWQFTANYLLDDWHLKDYSVKNPYIKLYRSSSNGENYVIIEVLAYQFAYKETNTEIYESDVNIRLSWILEFENQLAGFKTLMRRPAEDGYEIISTAVFNSSNAVVSDSTYYFYDYPSSREIEIYFGEVPDYRPPYGSSIRFFTYSTMGAEGNFSYNGYVTFRLVTSDEDIALGYTDKSEIRVLCKNVTDSTGGKNRPSALEIKDDLIKAKLIRNNLITDYDLDVYFNSQVIKDVVNGGEIVFFKHRDDVIRRMFSAFALLRDNYRRIVPTNTVSFVVDYSRLEAMKNSIKPGTIVIYDRTARVYRILEEEEYPEAYINDNRNFIYAIPYLLAFKLDPFPRMIYYSIDVDLNQPMYMKEDPVFSWEVLINNLKIQRGSVYDAEYYISLNMNTNINSYVSSKDELPASDFLRVRLLIKNQETNEYLFCIDLDKEKGTDNTYSAYIHSEDEIEEDGSLVIYSVAGTRNLLNLSGEDLAQTTVPEKFTIEAVVLYDALGCEGAGISSQIADESLTLHPMFQQMIDLTGTLASGAPYQYGIAAIFKQGDDDYFYFHRNKSNFIYSDALVNSNATIVFHNIPVIGLKYFSDRDNYKEVNRVLRVYETLLDENKDRLENNTMISFKFYNSYGVSKYYQIDSTNLFIEMKIKLNTNKTQELDARIRAAIVAYTEQSNSINVLDFSSIVTLLRNTFPEILLINIVGLNSLGIQSIERYPNKAPERMTTDELRNYVPEFLNVNLEENLGRLTYSLKLTYI